jgi:hypothetical protein
VEKALIEPEDALGDGNVGVFALLPLWQAKEMASQDTTKVRKRKEKKRIDPPK